MWVVRDAEGGVPEGRRKQQWQAEVAGKRLGCDWSRLGSATSFQHALFVFFFMKLPSKKLWYRV